MSEIITPYHANLYYNVDCNPVEYVTYHLPALAPFFAAVRAHDDVPNLNENTAYFYTTVRIAPECSHCGCNLGDLRIPSEGVDNIFFDNSDRTFPPFCGSIFLRQGRSDRRCGAYCQKRNILFASDWTHFPNPEVRMIISAMEKAGWIKARKRDSRMMKKVPLPKVTLGSDPEFEGYIGGQIVPASRITGSTSAMLGCDGAGGPVEIRPVPAEDPKEVVANIRRCLEMATKHYEDLSIEGNYYSLGGHIHVGIHIDGKQARYTGGDLIKLFDDFVGIPMDPLNGARRKECGYGRINAWRTQPWGIEYRTPSSRWMQDPKVTRILFKIVKYLTIKYFTATRPIKYDTPVSNNTYKRFAHLTDNELKTWREFLAGKRKTPRHKIFATWKLPGATKGYINIQFRDEWERRVVEEVEVVIKRIRTKKAISVILFGLKKERGEVISIDPLLKVPLPEGYKAPDKFEIRPGWIGLPYSFRKRGENRLILMGWIKEVIKKCVA